MRQIKVTEEHITAYLDQIKEQLINARMYRSVTFKFDPAKAVQPEVRPVINFNALAYVKMRTLVQSCSTECAWHGVVEANEERTRFDITDILVYPQDVTGVTVKTDEIPYTKWKNELSDDVYNNLRMQGHSHVSMSATPSSVDTTMYDNMLSVLGPNSYYIFMITNKQGNIWVEIHDIKNNVIYDTDDIDITVSTLDMDEWYQEQCSKIKKPSALYKGYNGVNWTPRKDVVYGGQTSMAEYYDDDSPIGFNDSPYASEFGSISGRKAYDSAFDSASGRKAMEYMKQTAPKTKRGPGRPKKGCK